jgi:hypothetical protein
MTSSIEIETPPAADATSPGEEQTGGSPPPDRPESPRHSLLVHSAGASKILPTMILPLSPAAVLDEKMFVFKGEHSSNSR